MVPGRAGVRDVGGAASLHGPQPHGPVRPDHGLPAAVAGGRGRGDQGPRHQPPQHRGHAEAGGRPGRGQGGHGSQVSYYIKTDNVVLRRASPILRRYFAGVSWTDVYNRCLCPPIVPNVTGDADTRCNDNKSAHQRPSTMLTIWTPGTLTSTLSATWTWTAAARSPGRTATSSTTSEHFGQTLYKCFPHPVIIPTIQKILYLLSIVIKYLCICIYSFKNKLF